MWICYAINSTRRFHEFLSSSFLEFAINQNASINKNSKNSNSKSLKQHTFAKSISFCCFFVRKIDRFIILICRYFRDQNFQQDFHFRFRIYFLFSFSHFLFSHLFFHVYCICFEIFNVNHDQTDIWIIVDNFFRNVDRSKEKNNRFETKFEKKKKK